MWAICEFARQQIKKLHAERKIDPEFKDKIEREMLLLETISNDNRPDLSGDFDDLIRKCDWEENTIVEINEFNTHLKKSILYDRIRNSLTAEI